MSWVQWWVVPAATDDEAGAHVRELLDHWTPATAAMPTVTAIRFYQGPDELAITEQYLEEVAQIRDVAASTPRETLARRFAVLYQRALGIPPRPGWVTVGNDGPRSPRPVDWTRSPGPRWVVTVTWPGEVPTLDPQHP